MPRIKICCMQSVAEMELAVRHGAGAIGLVSEMPSGAGVIDDERIREIAAAVPAGVSAFLLTSKTDPEAIAEQQRRAGTDTVQLVDRIGTEALRKLRRLLPGVDLVQVVHVIGDRSAGEAVEVAPLVDAILLDSGNPESAVKELGGTGRVHDWERSAEIVRAAEKPVWLAGGLGPENVGEAIRRVRPHGVDVCSGLRPEGGLDESLLARFIGAVRAAAGPA